MFETANFLKNTSRYFHVFYMFSYSVQIRETFKNFPSTKFCDHAIIADNYVEL